MKLIDALEAGFSISFCKSRPVRDIRIDKEQGVVYVGIDGGRTEHFSTQFSVPNDTLELSTVLNFNEDIAAALLLPSGVAAVSKDDISPAAMNISMRRAADNREGHIHNRTHMGKKSMFHDPSPSTGQEAQRALTSGINTVNNNNFKIALDKMFKKEDEGTEDLTK